MTIQEGYYYQFNKFLLELFSNFDFDSKIVQGMNNAGVDLILNMNSKIILLEVKVYRSKNYVDLDNALNRLNNNLYREKASSGVLVITSILEKSLREEFELEYGLSIIDRNLLFYLTKNNHKLRFRLTQLLNSLKHAGDDDIFEGLEIPEEYELNKIWSKSVSTIGVKKQIVKTGSNLCLQLDSIPLGPDGSKEFEKICLKILKYLFENDLSSWKEQNTTEDKLHRFDLIAKISSSNDFWKYLARDFKTRFVIFEFKNYTKKIGQGQVYTTEKYLFTKALRSVAYIISRKGINLNGDKAMKGALKESGKLIMSLDESDLCEMLRLKDKGSDPNTLIANKLDNTLMNLAR